TQLEAAGKQYASTVGSLLSLRAGGLKGSGRSGVRSARPRSGELAKSAPKITLANSTKGWKVGDPINNLTRAGNIPKWPSVRMRHWKNRAHYAKPGEFTDENIARMKRGRAPLVQDKQTGEVGPLELHHHIVPQRSGGLFDFIEVTPSQHAKIDAMRHLKPKP
ncbi:MAG: hypothetical protein SFX74_07480, partial [Fimbriimonadaceae bacterium]|nr:hypothetical protein [Fimbriimonadaceae bacterium]